jgi:hypothetical protein
MLVSVTGVSAESLQIASGTFGFTTNEARTVWRIEQLVREYQETSKEAKEESITQLKAIYLENASAFGGIVVLNSLLNIQGLDAIKTNVNNTVLVQYARAVRKGSSEQALFIRSIEDPGLQEFLRAWRDFRLKGQLSEGENVKDTSRTYLLLKEKRKIKASVQALSEQEQISAVFRCLDEWNSCFDYEGASLLLIEAVGDANVNRVVSELIDLLEKRAPDTVSPPYVREHTTFVALCSLAKSLGDERLIVPLEKLSASGNAYVKKYADEALLWLRSGICYPLKYHELKSSFDSRE